jgi:hypothetical protein
MAEALFAIFEQNGDDLVDLHRVGAFGNHDLAEHALIDGFDFHRRFVGFDFGKHIAGTNAVTFGFQPFGKFALFHGRRERRHQNINRHGYTLPLKRDVCVELRKIRLRIALRELSGIGDDRPHILSSAFRSSSLAHFLSSKRTLTCSIGIVLGAHLLHLILGAILCRVGHGVTAITVGQHFKNVGAFAGARMFQSFSPAA